MKMPAPKVTAGAGPAFPIHSRFSNKEKKQAIIYHLRGAAP